MFRGTIHKQSQIQNEKKKRTSNCQNLFSKPTYYIMDFLVSLEKAQIVPTVCGSLSFALTMVLSTTLQHKFRISTGATNAMLPILTGVFTVGMGSLASNKVSRETLRYINGHNNDNWWQSSPTNYRSKRPTNNLQLTSHYTRITLLGLLTYRVLLNSRFMSVAPSSFTNLGAFAKKGIPATLEYATGKERRTIQMLGKDFGCHTCGVKGRVKFNADHMPPLSIVKRENMKFLRKVSEPILPFTLKELNHFLTNQQRAVENSAKSEAKVLPAVRGLLERARGTAVECDECQKQQKP